MLEYKKTSVNNIPEEWELMRLGDVADDFVGGGTPSTSNPDYWNGRIAWMTSAHINGRVVTSGQRYITEKGLNESSTHIIPKGNLLVATRVGIGKAATNSIDVAISQDLTGVIIKKDKASVDYVYWFLIDNSNWLKSLAQGSTIKGVLKEDLANLKFPLPPLPEQRRIAEVLGTVDSAIQKVGGAIEKTERLKKGLMQRLLTKGIGHERLKFSKELGCAIPEEWELLRLGDIADDFIGGGTPSTSNPNYWNGKIAWMTSAHISGRVVTSGQRYITEKGLNESSSHLIPKGNLLIATRVGIGKAAINSIDVAISQDLTGVIIKKDKASVDYIYWFLLNNPNKLKSLAQGSTIKGLLKDDLANLKLPLPPLPEQRRIAEILSAADRKLELERRRKEKLERVKKGMMNELLTGRKRVKVD